MRSRAQVIAVAGVFVGTLLAGSLMIATRHGDRNAVGVHADGAGRGSSAAPAPTAVPIAQQEGVAPGPTVPGETPASIRSRFADGVTAQLLPTDSAVAEAVQELLPAGFELNRIQSVRDGGRVAYDTYEVLGPRSTDLLTIRVFQSFDPAEAGDLTSAKVAGGTVWYAATDPTFTSVYFLSADKVAVRVARQYAAGPTTKAVQSELTTLAVALAALPGMRAEGRR